MMGKVRRGQPEYTVWASMKQRCFDANSKAYPYYGGRGITVCGRWLDFRHFLNDMGPRPEGHSIERIDNDGNYEPCNCKWATPLEQARNRRKYTKHKDAANAWVDTPEGRAPQATSKAAGILNDVKNGRLFREIAAEYKVTMAYISRLRAKAGVPRRIEPRIIPPPVG